jgi:CTP synthase
VREAAVIEGRDCASIYEVPIRYHAEGFDTQLLATLGLPHEGEPDLEPWRRILDRLARPEGEVTVAVVGKYTGLADAYKSLAEALVHGGIANRVRVRLDWVDAEELAKSDLASRLADAHAVLVPGGFGERGVEGKIAAVTYARERKLPFFGICFGMQLACIEAARNIAGLEGASSTEFGPCRHPIVGLLTEWEREGAVERGARPATRRAGRCGSAPIPAICCRVRSSSGPTGRDGSASATATATR